MPPYTRDVVLLMVLAACVATDVKRGRIFDAITYPAIAFGLVSAAFGPPGLRSAVVGLVAAAVPMYVAAALGALGGGNLKLMAAVGALKGFSFAITALFCSILVGGIWAALVLMWSGQARAVLSDFGKVFSRGATQSREIPPRGVPVPFSLAIAAGTVTTLILEWRLRL